MDSLLGYTDNHDQNVFLNTLRDSIILVAHDRTILFANISALNLLGHAEASLIGKKFEEVVQLQVDGSAAIGSDSPITKATNKNGIYASASEPTIRTTMGRSDRSMLPVTLSVLPVEAKGGAVSYVVVFHDSDADEKIDQAKSEFIALVSHQLRTPINIISWYVEKLLNEKHGGLNDSQKTYLNEVALSNKRVTDLVQAIVNVSRTDLSRIKHKHERVLLDSLIEKLVEELLPSAQQKNINLELEIYEDSLVLNDSDQELVGVTLRNILTNSIRYTQDGGSVKINVLNVEKGKAYHNYSLEMDGYIIKISDDGIGIPDEEKGQIFTKLFRASNVQALDVTGVGLGLYIAQSFVQELGGHIWFDSELRGGTVFYIFIPNGTENSL